MEELQSWWEVPAIAHFCNVFQAAFRLFYFDVEELEASLLQQNLDESVSVEHLIMRLLPRCCGVKDLNCNNWEDHLHKLLAVKWPKEGRKNPLGSNNSRFNSLPLRSKVDILYSLCHYRLDAEDVFDVIKNIDGQDLRADCVGIDSEKNIYWYFGGVRLYKEVQNKQDTKTNDKKNSRTNKFTKSKSPISHNWTVACFTKEDWEDLLKRLKKKKNGTNKKLCENIEENYIPILSAITARKERELKKRLMELAPRRSSSRIDDVRRKREIEEQRAAELVEQERLKKAVEDEKRRAIEEKERKKREIRDRAKRVEERRKALEARATRARYRDLRSVESEEDFDSCSLCSSTLECIHGKSNNVSYDSSDDESSDFEEGEDECETVSDQDDEPESGNEQLCSINDRESRNSNYCDKLKGISQRLPTDVSSDESSSEENIPFFAYKKIKLVKTKDYINGKNQDYNSSSPTWRCLKAVTVPCKKLVDYGVSTPKQRENEAAGQERLRNTAEELNRQPVEKKLRRKGGIEKRHKAMPDSEHDENDDDSESNHSYLDATEINSQTGAKEICSDKNEILLRNISCESNNRKDRKPMFWNNSQCCVNLKEFNNSSLHSNIQIMSTQQSSSQQNNPFFSHKKITIVKPRRDFVNGRQQDDAPPSPTWRCLKTVSVPCKKLVGYDGERDLPDCEMKGNQKFYSKSGKTSNSITKFDMMNGTQKTISRVH